MTDATGREQDYASEISDAERRRRLASVYRLLIEIGQRGSPADKEGQAETSSADDQSKRER